MKPTAFVLAAMLGCTQPTRPPIAPENVLVDLSAVRFTIDSLSVYGIAVRQEQAACVASYKTLYGANARVYIVTAIRPPVRAFWADSTHIYTEGARSWCEPDQPGIHTHVVTWWTRRWPSAIDSATASRSKAPFQLLIIGGTDSIVIYGIRP